MADDPTRYLDVSGVLALKYGSTVDVDYTITHARSVAARDRELGARVQNAQDAADRAEAAIWPKGALGDRVLNTVLTPGTYWQSTAAFATVARGYPAEGGIGVLTVEQFASSIYMQRFTRIGLNGWLETFVRTVAPGGPGEWASEARAATSGGPMSSPIRLTTAEDNDFNALEPGMYYVPFGSHAKVLGLPVEDHGLLIVHHYGGKTGGAWFYPRSGAGIWRRAKNSGSWGQWENIIPGSTEAPSTPIRLTTAEDNDFTALAPGMYYVPFGSHATALGLPVADHGFLTVYHYGTQSGAAWYLPRTAAGLWKRAKNSGTWGPWENIIPEPSSAVTMDAALRHEHIATRHAARIGAPINVGAATPIAFVWDDYPAAMRDKGVVAAAREFGIPINAALCSRTLTDRAEKLGGVGITWGEIDAWASEGTVEITHHGQTHDYTVTDLTAEIVTGLEELRGHCPSADITTWATPANNWTGFNEGRTADNWASPAGQLIHAHHAYAMGRDYVLGDDHSVPMTGTPIPGQGRMWVEAVGMTVDARKKRVTDMYGTGRGAVLAAHAEWIGQEGRWTTAEVREFFAWLRAEEDAGRIKLMHLSRWAWARTTP